MIELRPYQVRFVKEVHNALRRCQRVVAVAPTGSGKRYIACWWATHIPTKGRRVGIITDRRVLVDQMADECRANGIEYGILMGDSPRNDSAPVQICSVQTLKRRKWKDRPEADWWIIDEGHKESDAYGTLARLYPTSKIVGLTATPVGASGRSLINGSLYEECVEPVKNTELIAGGYLLNTEVVAPSEPYMKGVKISAGEYNQEQLGKRVEECTVFGDVFEWYRRFGDRSTIVFAPRVVFARGISDQFQSRGIAAAVIEAKTEREERRRLFENFGTGGVDVLVSVDVLREGFDAPSASLGIDLQPNKQFRTYWQKLGRVKRPHESQEKAVWLDFAGNYWNFPHPDEDPTWPEWYSQATTQDVIKKQRNTPDKGPWQCPHCFLGLAPWQRVHGNVCPNCGEPIGKQVRRIRMQDGRLKTVSAKEKKKKVRTLEEQTWWRCLYQSQKGELNWARVSYYKQMGKWPDPKKLPFCPEGDSPDWERNVFTLYPQLDKRRR